MYIVYHLHSHSQGYGAPSRTFRRLFDAFSTLYIVQLLTERTESAETCLHRRQRMSWAVIGDWR